MPLAVLVDRQHRERGRDRRRRRSADHRRGAIVGTRTFGKGSLQSVEPLVERRRAQDHDRGVPHAEGSRPARPRRAADDPRDAQARPLARAPRRRARAGSAAEHRSLAPPGRARGVRGRASREVPRRRALPRAGRADQPRPARLAAGRGRRARRRRGARAGGGGSSSGSGGPATSASLMRAVLIEGGVGTPYPEDALADARAAAVEPEGLDEGRVDLRELTTRDRRPAGRTRLRRRDLGRRRMATRSSCSCTSRTSRSTCARAAALDREASRRALSVYVPGRVEPMLPPRAVERRVLAASRITTGAP